MDVLIRIESGAGEQEWSKRGRNVPFVFSQSFILGLQKRFIYFISRCACFACKGGTRHTLMRAGKNSLLGLVWEL